uniref:non-specific serine/threonine protein kinase n=1 Tax=Oryza rufipogon TaxID=4529 RepID=A0A0E0PXF5_ORYRU
MWATLLCKHLQIKIRIGIVHQLVLLLMSSSLFLVVSAQSVPADNMDQEALLGLKSLVTSDPSGMLLSWGNGSACTWSGVRCNRHGRVLVLDLQGLNLVGKISPSIGNLSALHGLYLQKNQFSGEIPDQIGWLGQLQTLNASANILTGNIPAALINCTNLEIIDLSQNTFFGTIPASISSFQKLRVLKIGGNQLSGSVPRYIGNLSLLSTLDLSTNNLTGTIPYEFGHLRQLKFTGPIPPSLHNVTNIQSIRMSHNHFSGSVPPGLSGLHNLVLYNIGFNQIVGNTSVLVDLMNCTKLQLIAFDENLIEGILPDSIGNLSSSLTRLYVGGNRITGYIPASIGRLSSLTLLNMSYIQPTFWNLKGGIPASIFSLNSLSTLLNLSHNLLTGSIRENIGQLGQITAIDLSYNFLNGSIPVSIGKCQSLQSLSLSRNSLSGVIPGTIGNLKGLQTLDLSSNQLSGIIPATLVKMQALRLLNLSMNDLDGLVPNNGIFKDHSVVYLDGNPKLCYSNMLCYYIHSSHRRKMAVAIAVGTAAMAAITIVVIISMLLLPRKWLRNRKPKKLGSFIKKSHPLVSYEELNQDLIHKGRQGENVAGVNADMILSIAIDVASALDYLHNDCGEQVVHCDIKPSNVLLDEDMTAKVGDFGLARLLSPTSAGQDVSSTHGLKGSIGYIPPAKGDVYSYGMLLLEMITGKRPVDPQFGGDMNLEKWVRDGFPHRAHEVVDERLRGTIVDICHEGQQQASAEQKRQQLMLNNIILPVMEVALSCALESPDERSTMRDALCRLKRIKEAFLKNHSF